jgi:hypothetical protein
MKHDTILDLADALCAAKLNLDDAIANPNKTEGQIRAALQDLLDVRFKRNVAAHRHSENNAALRRAAVEVKETCGLMWISSGDKHAKLKAALPAAVAKVNVHWEISCKLIGMTFRPLAAGEICDLCDTL